MVLMVFLLLLPVSFSMTSNSTITEDSTENIAALEFSLVSAQGTPTTTKARSVELTNASNRSLGGAIATAIGNWLGLAILTLAAAFTWVGGEFLHQATVYLVFQMGSLVNSQLGSAIDVSWGIIRDICNLIFIFGFIYIGISTIIDPHKASTKRMLAQIIIGALLINFSLFIVKFVIDFANFLAIQIYNAMTTGTGNISLKIADLLGIFEIYSSPTKDALAGLTTGGSIWFFILGAVFLLIAAFVFFMAAVLLIIRFIALVLIMVFSPFLFAATVFPNTQGIASDLWSKLMGYSFFAPLYFLLILVSIRLLEGLMFLRGNNTLVKGLAPLEQNNAQTGSFGVILYFLIAAGFLIAATTIAHRIGMKGGEFAIKFAGGMTYGLAARMGRATIGRYAYNKSESDSLKDAASQKGLKGWGARQALKASRVVGDSSLDLRNAPGGNNLQAGKGMKGGYKTKLDDLKKKEDAFAKSLGEVGDDDVRVEARKKEMEHLHHQLTEHKDIVNDAKADKRDAEREKTDATNAINAAKNRLKSLNNDLLAADDDKKREEINAAIKKENLDLQTEQERLTKANKLILDSTGILSESKKTIEKLEDDSKKAKTTYENEKQRRILGSTFNTPSSSEIEKLKGESKKANDEIKAKWDEFTHLGEDKIAKEKMLPDIEDLKKTYKEKVDKQNALVRKQMIDGYVNVIENSSILTSWPEGRLVSQQKAIGKAMRKKYEKGIPKEKDDHGGGDHDDHGGGAAHAPAAHAPASPAPKPAAPAHPPAGGGDHGGGHGGGHH